MWGGSEDTHRLRESVNIFYLQLNNNIAKLWGF